MATRRRIEAAGADDQHLTVQAEHHGARQRVHYLRRRTGPRWAGYTAFVLSGGGARGALQVGALRALLEHGERPDVVVGTSIGAWNGSWLARTPTLAGLEALANVWRGLSTARVLLGRDLPANYPQQALTGLLMFTALRRLTRGSSSLYGDEGLRQLLDRLVGNITFADLALPFSVVATDLSHGDRAVFDSGPLAPVLLASSAIPGVFPPVRIGDSVYSDGGTVDSCSLETALQLGARRIFILAVGHDLAEEGGQRWSIPPEPAEPPTHGATPPLRQTMTDVIERAAQVMGHHQLKRVLDHLPRGVEAHLISLSTGSGYNSLDFSATGEWMERAYRCTRDYLHTAFPDAETNAAAVAS